MGLRKSWKGRPFTLLGLDPRNLALGIDIRAHIVRGLLINFNGEIINSHQTLMPRDSDPERVGKAVADTYAYLQTRGSGISHGLGISK